MAGAMAFVHVNVPE
jgi:hypothetical protein